MVFKLAGIAIAVLLTFIVIWYPWIHSWAGLQQVVHRIFPIARSVFEDKVSNAWCMLNVAIKIKYEPARAAKCKCVLIIFLDFRSLINNQQMALICMLTTLLFCLPSCYAIIMKRTKKSFIQSLICCSLAFYLFSFQVRLNCCLFK